MLLKLQHKLDLKKILSLTSFKNKNVIEIGSGTGNLSTEILKSIPNKLICIEKDKIFAKNLKTLFNILKFYTKYFVLKLKQTIIKSKFKYFF